MERLHSLTLIRDIPTLMDDTGDYFRRGGVSDWLARAAADDTTFHMRLCEACELFFNYAFGMEDVPAITGFLELAALLEAKNAFGAIYHWFSEKRLETVELLPVPEDDMPERRSLVSKTLQTLSLLQPQEPEVRNFWLQLWHDDSLVAWHMEAFIGLLRHHPSEAAMELPELMRRDLPETADILKQFHQDPEARRYLLEALDLAHQRGSSWYQHAWDALGLPN